MFSLLLAACGFEAPLPEDPLSIDAPLGTATGVDAALLMVDAPALPQLTPQAYIERVIRAECVQAFNCRPQYPQSGPSFTEVWGTDLNNCVAIDRDYLQRDAIAAAVAGGTITFTVSFAMTCLANPGIPTSCSTLFAHEYRFADVCYAALLGHIANGGVCTTDWECAIGSVCRGTCSR